MAWRPSQFLKRGWLDCTVPGKVTGWMEFVGIYDPVNIKLTGEVHDDVKGRYIEIFCHLPWEKELDSEFSDFARRDLELFSTDQVGHTGDITLGNGTYVRYPYFEWYSDDNGRVCIELTDKTVGDKRFKVCVIEPPQVRSFPASLHCHPGVSSSTVSEWSIFKDGPAK